jgi:hypothetical protein
VVVYLINLKKEMNMKKIILWLFVIVLGITFGAGIYEARIVVPEWINSTDYFWNAEAANQSDTGVRFWIFVTSIPLTLLTITSAISIRYTKGSLRKWWGISTGAAVIDRMMTFGYFVPTMIGLMEHGNSADSEIVKSAILWSDFNYVRIAVVLIAWITAMKALTVYYSKYIDNV